jgi:hypothetical protein
MNKKQCCVAENDLVDFRYKCNELMEKGWNVIPGTIISSIAMGTSSGSGYNSVQTEKVLVAFFEK